MGSPDMRQIDGMGGATSVTSKVCIISKSELEKPDPKSMVLSSSTNGLSCNVEC